MYVRKIEEGDAVDDAGREAGCDRECEYGAGR